MEPTSGNTGVGLAMAAAIKGYRCIFVMADKQSEEKRALLRAYGAEVVICPTDVDPDDERSYYRVSIGSRARRPALEAGPVRQPANPEAHYLTTGPRSGTRPRGASRTWWWPWAPAARSAAPVALTERNPAVRVGADPAGSVYSGPIRSPT